MRRRIISTLAALAIGGSLLGVQPASATHGCTDPGCNPVTVAILEGIGFVCNEAGAKLPTGAKIDGKAVPSKCSYSTDPLWDGPPPPVQGGEWQGLTWPGAGPPAVGPFTFKAGSGLTPPTSICVSSAGGAGCVFDSFGLLLPGDPSGLGAYCGSSEGRGFSRFTAGDQSLITEANFGWSQSAATILPLTGTVTKTDPVGGKGATVVGFTSSRGTDGGGNCNVTQVTTRFNVEGMIVTF